MAVYSRMLFCSIDANVNGIKFYSGVSQLQSLRSLKFEREHTCVHDSNAILVKIEDDIVLGHLEEHIAMAIAPLIDQNLPGFIYHLWVYNHAITQKLYHWPMPLFVQDMH